MRQPSQGQRILAYMQDFGSITPMEAIFEIGCTKLATRVSELIRAGHKIQKETVYGKNRWGQTIHYMRYRMGVE